MRVSSYLGSIEESNNTFNPRKVTVRQTRYCCPQYGSLGRITDTLRPRLGFVFGLFHSYLRLGLLTRLHYVHYLCFTRYGGGLNLT